MMSRASATAAAAARLTAGRLPAVGVVLSGLAAIGMLLLHAQVYSDPVQGRSAAFRRVQDSAGPGRRRVPAGARDTLIGMLPEQDFKNYPKVPHSFEAVAGWLPPPFDPLHPRWREPPETRRYADCDAVRFAGNDSTAADSLHATSLAAKWGELVRSLRGDGSNVTNASRNASQSRHVYCVAMCRTRRCCPSAWVDESAFERLSPGPAWDAAAAADPTEVSLVTQATPDRTGNLATIVAAWPGPIVAVFAIYNNSGAGPAVVATAAEHRRHLESFAAAQRHNVQILIFSVLMPHRVDWYSRRMVNNTQIGLYPVNALRNAAIDHAWTNWVFPCDVDFVPSASLYHTFRQLHAPALLHVNRAAVVVPHWELPACADGLRLVPPADFAALRRMVHERRVFPFHVRTARVIPALQREDDNASRFEDGGEYLESAVVGQGQQQVVCERTSKRSWPWGVLDTNYSRWWAESSSGRSGLFRLAVDAVPVDISLPRASWEPFLLLRRAEADGEPVLPRFSEHFVGRYRNKVEFVSHLRAHKYKFFTALQDFVTHVPHPVSDPMEGDMQLLKDAMIALHISKTRALQAASMWQILPASNSHYEQGYICGGT